MTQRRRTSKDTEAEPPPCGPAAAFLAGAGAAACAGCGAGGCGRKAFAKPDNNHKAEKQPVGSQPCPACRRVAGRVGELSGMGSNWIFPSADSFRAGCSANAGKLRRALGLNTVLAQVRPFGDALYKSQPVPVEPPVHRRAGAETPVLTRWTSFCRRPTGAAFRWKRG